MPDSYAPTISNRPYVLDSDGAEIHPIYRFSLFVGDGPEPPGGRVCVAYSNLFGFQASFIPDEIDSGYLKILLDRGYAVAVILLPPARSDTLANLPDASSPNFDPQAGEFGPPYPKGGGAMVGQTGEVGVNWPGGLPPGYADPTHPWLDPLFPMGPTAAARAIQHLRYHARPGTHPQSVTGELPIRGDKIAVAGNSASAFSFAFPAMAPDLAGVLEGGTPQELVSTRVQAAILLQVPGVWQFYVLDGERPTDPGVAVGYKPYMFAHADGGTGGNSYDEPAGKGDGASGTGFPAFEETALGWLFLNSPLIWGTDVGGLASDITAQNEAVPFYVRYNEPVSPLMTGANRYLYPYSSPLVTVEETAHPISQGYAFKAAFASNTRFVCSDADAIDADAGVGGGPPPDAVIEGAAANEADIADWLDAALGIANVPIEEKVIARTLDLLREISPANGYMTTVQVVRRVHDLPAAEEVLLPALFVTALRTRYQHLSATITQATTTLSVIAAIGNSGSAEVENQVSAVIADIRKRLLLARFGPTNDFGDLPVESIEILRSERWTAFVAGQDSTVGGVVEVAVSYREQELDPYQGAPTLVPHYT